MVGDSRRRRIVPGWVFKPDPEELHDLGELGERGVGSLKLILADPDELHDLGELGPRGVGWLLLADADELHRLGQRR